MSQKTLPPPDLVARWDTTDVADWLRHNDMPEFISAFNNNCVNGARLLELDEHTIKSYSGQLSQQKIVKLLDKVRKCKKEKSGGGIFQKFKYLSSHVPPVPDRDYKTCSNANSRVDNDDDGWGSDFSEPDGEMDESYESPPDPMRSEAPRFPPRNQFPPPVKYPYNDDDEGEEDYSEDYIIPIESPSQPVEESDEEQYLAPDGNADDELYEVPDEDSHLQPRMRQPDMPPARPPKLKKDYMSTPSRPPQVLVPAPSLTAPCDIPPRPPARRSVSPIRTPNSYRSQPEIPEDYEEETYEAPHEDMDDCDQTYAVPEDASPEPCTRSPAFLLPVSEPKNISKFMMPPARPAKKPLPSPTNDAPAVPPPIIRYPKTDTSKPAKDPPIVRHPNEPSRPAKEPPKTEDANSSVINKMKQRFEQRSPTLPRRDGSNGSNQETTKNSSFLHKKLAQPPLPSKTEVPAKEPRTNSKPELPRRKHPVAHKLPVLPQTISSSLASKLNDSSKITPSPAQRLAPNPVQRNTPNPVQRNTPSPSQLTQPPISPNRKPLHQELVVGVGSSNTKSASNSMDGYPWYHADLPRERAQKSLEEFRRDGAFLVRDSKRGGTKNPFTLSLWYNNQVRNLQMRSRSDGKYALGSMKDGEQTFDSPLDLVVFHQSNPLILANNEGKTKLKTPCPVY